MYAHRNVSSDLSNHCEKLKLLFSLLLRAEVLLLRPIGAWTSFLMCQDLYLFEVQACKTTRGAHLHVNALSASWCKPIFSQGQLDLKLFSDAVSQFISAWSNLHGALSSWAPCWDWMRVGEDPLFKQTGVRALSLRLTSCHQILISSPQLSSQQQAKGNSEGTKQFLHGWEPAINVVLQSYFCRVI